VDNINIIDKVVIYSMNKREKTFGSKPIKNAQMDYFISYLPSNRYLSNDRRLLEPKTLVLFQYDAHIIASGVLIKKEKIVDEKYKYASYFEPISITIFQIPITTEDMRGVSRNFVKFSNRQWVIMQDEIPDLLSLLQERQPLSAENPWIFDGDNDTYQEEVNEVNNPNADIKYSPREPVTSQTSGKTVYARNKMTAARALKKAMYQCEVKGCTGHYFMSATTNKNYVEAHHLIPFEIQIYFTKGLDVEANIVSLCVFCHSKLHYGIMEEKMIILRQLYAERIEFLKICEINVDLEQLLSYYHPSILKTLRKSRSI